MVRYFIKKLITLVVLLLLVSITVFSVLFVLPGAVTTPKRIEITGKPKTPH